MDRRKKELISRGVFVTGTDTGVGKTVATAVLATLLKNDGYRVGVLKPVQCGGKDSQVLKDILSLNDDIREINPCFTPTSASPHVAFQKEKINLKRIFKTYKELKLRYDIVLVEGAGGLLVPLLNNYLVVDLIKDLDCDCVVVARSGLGTINHTLLTLEQLKAKNIKCRGIVFSDAEKKRKGIPEKTNPKIIKDISKVSIIGTIPYLKSITQKEILKSCQGLVDIKFFKEKKKSFFNTKKLIGWDKKYLWHPFTQMQDWEKEDPLIIVEGEGSYLKDTKGNRYLDGISSLWVNVHGHRNKKIDQMIKNQVDQLSHSTLLGLSNKPAIELAKNLVDITPKGLDKVFYSDSGSTSVEIAIKMAYQYWQNKGKTKKRFIAHLENSYHGDTLGSVSVGGIDLFHKVYQNLVFKTIKVDFPDCYRAPKGKKYPEYAFECLEKYEEILKKQSNSIAALVVEPIVQGAAGMIMWPKGILKRMAQLSKEYNVIFIADEVATGFGRTGKMFACEHEDVVPDIMCLAKGITGGYLPLAATMTSKKIYDGFLYNYEELKTFFHGHTYTGNPLCCAAGLANLKIFQKERVLEKLQPKIIHLAKRLKMFYNLCSVGDVRQRGFMVGIELVKSTQTQKGFDWQDRIGVKVCELARSRGVILRPLGNVIVLIPPLSMSIKEIDQMINVAYWAVSEIEK